jgi:ATP-dependent helicase HrpA
VLVFLPGEREIRDAHLALSRRKFRETEILPLYARLSANATRTACSSGTEAAHRAGHQCRRDLADGAAHPLRHRYRHGARQALQPAHKVQRLHIEPISQASADQRKGRCGRIAAGICYPPVRGGRFPGAAALHRSGNPARLAGRVILRMLSLGSAISRNFRSSNVRRSARSTKAMSQLVELGAIGEQRRQLTPLGVQMARMPIDVKLARMLIAAQSLGTARAERDRVVLPVASRIRANVRPMRARPRRPRACRKFADPKSDFVGGAQIVGRLRHGA